MLTTSCKKDYLDINTDPNNPTKAAINLVLPTAQGYAAYVMGNPFQVIGGFWAQYWTQGPTGSQYNNYDQYTITSANFDRQWRDIYAGSLNDLRYVIEEGTNTDQKNYVAVAKILQAYLFQIITDLHGDIPFSDALKAGEGNITPKYDTQLDIYDGLIKLVDEGLALIDVNSGNHPAKDDLIYGGNMQQWIRFANTLKLKIYLRQSYVRPAVAEAGIKALYTANAAFIGEGDEAKVRFTTTQFNENPLYAHFKALGEQNVLASETALDYMLNHDDARVDAFYRPAEAAPNTGNQVGIVQGNGKNLTGNLSDLMFSKPGTDIAGQAAPVVFFGEAESLLLQAEAIVRGWGTGNAQTLYNNAILLSFKRWGFSQADYNTYVAHADVVFPAAGTAEQKIRAIILQKWVSLDGTENVEAWTEWRRTGYPDIFTISATANNGGKFPARLLYPDSEVTSNPNTPPQKNITDKVWWDVNTTGQN
jgi:Starch-binding associating with outer membrane